MNRKEKILSGLDVATAAGIEIGALNRPIVTRAEGSIFYVDHTDTESLRRKYAEDPNVDTAEIVDVDAVWGDLSLIEATRQRRFDYLIASHVVEHVPDLIGWFEEVAAVLEADGTVRLAVPDRRFTFDLLRRESSVVDVINAYLMKPRVPLPIAVLDHVANVVKVDLIKAWDDQLDCKALVKYHSAKAALDVAREVLDQGSYHDVHCWVITPFSFAMLSAELAELSLLSFACEQFFDTERYELEFVVIMRKCQDRQEIISSWQKMAAASQVRAKSFGGATSEGDDRLHMLEGKIAELEKAQDRLKGMKASLSWRLTKPLRKVVAAFGM